jgi:hypothetical protein
MRSWIFGAITLACLTIGGVATACPVGEGGGQVRPQPRPVQNVSFQASELMERASRLENAAASRDQSARAFDQEADQLIVRARALRNQAQLVNVSDRQSIVQIADELTDRAQNDRALASSERAQASELRLEASGLRQRAVQLIRLGNGGGGWKGRAVPSTSVPSTPLPSERGVTL